MGVCHLYEQTSRHLEEVAGQQILVGVGPLGETALEVVLALVQAQS
jgi:hypothetical protein